MKRVFVDTNVLIDLLANREPHGKFAIEIFEKAENKTLQLFTSSQSIATTYYLLKKYHEDKKLRMLMASLMDYLTVIPVDARILEQAIRSRHKDFEDGVQIQCAMTVKNIFCIVTRNIKDYRLSEVKAMSPEELCDLI
jgi:predicted nucleic acid-binding protein